MLTVELKGVEEFNTAITDLITGLGLNYAEVFPQEGKLLAEECMSRCPPHPGSNLQASNATDAKKAGERTLKEDVRMAISTDLEVLGGKTKKKSLRKVIKNRNHEHMTKIFNDMPQWKGWRAVPFSKDRHRSVRGRGRYGIRKPMKVMTFDRTDRNNYVRNEQKKVGFMKAGFGITVAALGGRVPAWISRNFHHAAGYMSMDLRQDSLTPNITFGNTSPTIGRYSRLFEFALKERVRSMGVKLHQALERRLKNQFGK